MSCTDLMSGKSIKDEINKKYFIYKVIIRMNDKRNRTDIPIWKIG
jgi:hypothetical protein